MQWQNFYRLSDYRGEESTAVGTCEEEEKNNKWEKRKRNERTDTWNDVARREMTQQEIYMFLHRISSFLHVIATTTRTVRLLLLQSKKNCGSGDGIKLAMLSLKMKNNKNSREMLIKCKLLLCFVGGLNSTFVGALRWLHR